MTWYVGQKIVCIDDSWYGPHKRLGFKRFRFDNVIKPKNVYTIRRINQHNHFPDRLVILLSEVVHPRRPEHFGFPPEIFKPLLDKQTDISIFTDILNKCNMEMVE